MVKSKDHGECQNPSLSNEEFFKAILCPQSSFWLSLIRSFNIWRLKKKHTGMILKGCQYITLPFADDFCLITSDKHRHQIIMNEINDITKSIGLTLKPVKCKSISIHSGKSDDCTFAIRDVVLKSLTDAPEKFLGSNISYKGKSKDIHELVKNKLEGMMDDIKKGVSSMMNLSWKYILNMSPHLWDTCWLFTNLSILSWKNWIISTPMPLRVYSIFHQKVLPLPRYTALMGLVYHMFPIPTWSHIYCSICPMYGESW